MTPLARLLILVVLAGVVGAVIAALRSYFARAPLPSRVERGDFAPGGRAPVVVQFTSPYCYECKESLPYLEATSAANSAVLTVVDAKTRPDLASKYRIRRTPTVLVLDQRGSVRGGWIGTPPEAELATAIASAGVQRA